MGEISRASPGRAGAEAPRKPPAFSRRPSGERPLCRPLSGAAPPRGGAAAEPERACLQGNPSSSCSSSYCCPTTSAGRLLPAQCKRGEEGSHGRGHRRAAAGVVREEAALVCQGEQELGGFGCDSPVIFRWLGHKTRASNHAGLLGAPPTALDLGNDVNRETNPRSALREAVTEQQQHQHHHHTRPIESNSSSVCS
ncbi:unnamed protein product [Lampetra fluviatilis]